MDAPTATPPKLLEHRREVLPTRHYSYRTEQSYLDWAQRYSVFYGKRPSEDRGA